MRKILLLLILLISAVLSVSAQSGEVVGSPWRAEYFNNPYLSGESSIVRFEDGIGFDWDSDPFEGVPLEDFSVRWGKGGTMAGGTYRFIVTAFPGFRLYLDNEVILDTWEGGSEGSTVGTEIFIAAGEHNLQLDYYSAGENSFIYLDWGLAPDGELEPQPTNLVTSSTVTVMTNTLNVRSEPRIANNLIARISRGQQYVRINTSEDDRWIQLDLGNGSSGWVSANFVSSNVADITADDLSGQTLISTGRSLLRTAPDSTADSPGLLLSGETATIIGRTADGLWWQIDDNGNPAWINAGFVLLSPELDIESIPVID